MADSRDPVKLPQHPRSLPWLLLFRLLLIPLLFGCLLFPCVAFAAMTAPPTLLTDPFLQLPSDRSVRVVWFTEFAGSRHLVRYGEELEKTAIATTIQLSRTREDKNSRVSDPPAITTQRAIWRHEAEVTDLPQDRRIPYQVTSVREDDASISSDTFTLAATPSPGTPLKILLTSDHQVKPMVTANLQKVVETVGQVDLVLFAGDLVNIADRASQWFDDRTGGAFFPALQGRGSYDLKKSGTTTRYTGGAIIQQAPMYTAIGNHEVMGRFSAEQDLGYQFDDSVPRSAAEERYLLHAAQANLDPAADPAARERWITDQSFNTTTYEELFTLPQSPTGGKRYYAVTFGDMRLVVLCATNMWRSPSLAPTTRGKYRERQVDITTPDHWGWGQHLFEAIAPGSAQYTWLAQELTSPAFQHAHYKVVMLHHPPHSLGENIVPAYTNPVQRIKQNPPDQTSSIRYDYPKNQDYLIRDIEPLLEQAGVQLVFFGHSHLWNRFVSPSGMHFLETSNVGNSYGSYLGSNKRNVPPDDPDNYPIVGDPNGLEPIIPTIAPLLDAAGTPIPHFSSNDMTVFSIFDTGQNTVSSYRFDTRQPDSAVLKFDEFKLKR